MKKKVVFVFVFVFGICIFIYFALATRNVFSCVWNKVQSNGATLFLARLSSLLIHSSREQFWYFVVVVVVVIVLLLLLIFQVNTKFDNRVKELRSKQEAHKYLKGEGRYRKYLLLLLLLSLLLLLLLSLLLLLQRTLIFIFVALLHISSVFLLREIWLEKNSKTRWRIVIWAITKSSCSWTLTRLS